MRTHFWMILAACCISAPASWALQPVRYVMQQLYQLNGNTIHYDYKVQLFDLASGPATDSIQGTLYRRGRTYLDSSSAAFTCIDDRYYAKIEHRSKTALVYSLKTLEQKLGVKVEDLNPSGLQVTDSLPMIPGSFRIDSSHSVYFKVSWQVRHTQRAADLLLWVRKSGYRVDRFEIDQMQYENARPVARIHYSIFNIRHEVPASRIDPTRVFSIRQNQVALADPYADYSLSTLLN